MKKRIVWIDLLRLIGIIGVMLMHIVGNTKYTFGNLSNTSFITYTYISLLSEYAVPLFVMISGMMFLKKDKISFKDMFFKYCLKIILAIIIFGTVMIILEELFTYKTLDYTIFKTIFIKLLTGELWAHMWYLYLILGLYLITPALIYITKNIEQNEYRNFLIILFILTIFLTTVNRYFNIYIMFNHISISGYIFYYLYGYYLYKYEINNKYKLLNYLLLIVSIIYIILFIDKKSEYLFEYTSFIPFIIASTIIVTIKDIKITKFTKIINSIGIHSFGIYIIHQFFINIIYKFIKFKYIIYHPYIGLILYLIIILSLSYITTYILKKIKIIDKYLL